MGCANAVPRRVMDCDVLGARYSVFLPREVTRETRKPPQCNRAVNLQNVPPCNDGALLLLAWAPPPSSWASGCCGAPTPPPRAAPACLPLPNAQPALSAAPSHGASVPWLASQPHQLVAQRLHNPRKLLMELWGCHPCIAEDQQQLLFHAASFYVHCHP